MSGVNRQLKGDRDSDGLAVDDIRQTRDFLEYASNLPGYVNRVLLAMVVEYERKKMNRMRGGS